MGSKAALEASGPKSGLVCFALDAEASRVGGFIDLQRNFVLIDEAATRAICIQPIASARSCVRAGKHVCFYNAVHLDACATQRPGRYGEGRLPTI